MDAYTLAGLIFMCVLGPAVGNYACSVVYRLPRGQTPFEKRPYCGHCGTMLQPRDLFPILSYVLARGCCRYCKGNIPSCYTWIEVWCLLIFVVHFLLFGIDERFLLLTSYAVFLVILAYIALQSQFVSSFMMMLAINMVALWRSMDEGSVLPWFQGGVVFGFVAMAVWQLSKRGKGVLADVPDYVWMCALAGASLPPKAGIIAVLTALLLYGLQRIVVRERSCVPAFAIAVHVVLLEHVWQRAIQPLPI